MNQFLKVFSISLLSAVSIEALHAQEVGRVLFAQGDVTQQTPDGTNGSLSKGSVIQKGSTLVVGSGKLQVRFVDGALMSFKPNSRFKINDYQFSSTDVASSKAETQLIEGGLRTITGAVGKLNRPAYRLETATGSIGIRGTEFVVDKAAITLIEGSVGFIPVKSSPTSEVTINAGQTLNGEKPQAPQTINKPVFDVPVAGQVNGIASTRSVESSVSNVLPATTSVFVTPITTTIQRQSDNIFLVSQDGAGHQGLATFSLNSQGVPVLTRVEGDFTTRYSSTSTTDTDPGLLIGANPQLVGSDGSKLQWGVWLDGLQSGSSGRVMTNGFPQNASLPMHWVVGETLSNLPTTGTLTYQTIGQSGSMQIGSGGWKSVDSAQSTLTIALSSSTANWNLHIQGQGATASFTNALLTYNPASGHWVSGSSPAVGTLTTSSGGVSTSVNLWGSANLYGNGATNAAAVYRAGNENFSTSTSTAFEAYGVVAYKKN